MITLSVQELSLKSLKKDHVNVCIKISPRLLGEHAWRLVADLRFSFWILFYSFNSHNVSFQFRSHSDHPIQRQGHLGEDKEQNITQRGTTDLIITTTKPDTAIKTWLHINITYNYPCIDSYWEKKYTDNQVLMWRSICLPRWFNKRPSQKSWLEVIPLVIGFTGKLLTAILRAHGI